MLFNIVILLYNILLLSLTNYLLIMPPKKYER